MKIRNTFAIFLISGFWHGSNWTFIIWGALNAIYFLPLLLTNNNRKNLGIVAEGKTLPTIRELISIIITFILTVFAWIFFRAESVGHAIEFISDIFSKSLFHKPQIEGFSAFLSIFIIIILFNIVEWNGRASEYAIRNIHKKSKLLRHLFYSFCIIMIILFSNGEENFIYFQF